LDIAREVRLDRHTVKVLEKRYLWKPFMGSTKAHASKAAAFIDKFHVMRHFGEALDKMRRFEYRRL
jgi:transposase